MRLPTYSSVREDAIHTRPRRGHYLRPSLRVILCGIPLLFWGNQLALAVQVEEKMGFERIWATDLPADAKSTNVVQSALAETTPTATPTVTFIATVPMVTATATAEGVTIATATISAHPDPTPSPHNTSRPSPMPTRRSTITPSATPTLVLTAAPTIESTPTASQTATPTFTPTMTRSARIDSDFDGILDRTECQNPTNCPDTDQDSHPDYLDIDSDNDGISDRVEALVIFVVGPVVHPVDLDDDKVPDYLDSDSDNDTLPDASEGHDGNLDGFPDRIATGLDDDGDGLDNAFDTIASGHSITNAIGSNAPLPNSSGGLPNWRNADDDGDGIPTIEEVGRNRSLPIDEDGDGTPDFLQPKVILYLFLPIISRPYIYYR